MYDACHTRCRSSSNAVNGLVVAYLLRSTILLIHIAEHGLSARHITNELLRWCALCLHLDVSR